MASERAMANVQYLHDHIMDIVAGDIPEDAPAPPDGDAVVDGKP